MEDEADGICGTLLRCSAARAVSGRDRRLPPTYASVAQSAEAGDLKSPKYGFESLLSHTFTLLLFSLVV
jgi:hypothetical protein